MTCKFFISSVYLENEQETLPVKLEEFPSFLMLFKYISKNIFYAFILM